MKSVFDFVQLLDGRFAFLLFLTQNCKLFLQLLNLLVEAVIALLEKAASRRKR